MPLLGTRWLDPELLDGDRHDPAELSHSLRQVTAVNRFLGGRRSLRYHLRPLLETATVRLLDLGTGNGDLLRDLISWGNSRGRGSWKGTGLDRHPQVLEAARARPSRATTTLLRGDAYDLPFADGSFDAVLATLTLHHFPNDGVVHVLGEMARVTRRYVIVSELERSAPNYVGALILAASLWRSNRITRHDGPLSVRRAFTVSELRRLGERAGLRGSRVSRHAFFRLILVGTSS